MAPDWWSIKALVARLRQMDGSNEASGQRSAAMPRRGACTNPSACDAVWCNQRHHAQTRALGDASPRRTKRPPEQERHAAAVAT